jgi:Kef-type K+ transport system membrane component KefB
VSSALLLVLLVVVAYLAAHVAFEWLARRYLVVSGAEYLVLGVLVGPQGFGLLPVEALDAFSPFLTVALGWVGAIVGMQFYLPALVRIPAQRWQIATMEALLTFVVVGSLVASALHWMFDATLPVAAAAGMALGAIATASAPTGIEVVARRLSDRGPLVRQLELTAAVDSAVAVLAIGLLACAYHVAPEGVRAPTTTEWAAISIGIGVVSGALFQLFLGSERESDRFIVSLVGAVALASGAASYLQLSSLLVCMVMGATLANTSGNRQAVARTLASAERPFYFVLLILAGASWRSGPVSWLVPLTLFLLARAVGKVGGARLAARTAGEVAALGAGWGRALLGQGGLALAIALEYARREGAFHELVFAGAIVSMLLTDFGSAWLVHSVVAPAGARRAAARAADPVPGPPEPAAPVTTSASEA